MFSSLDLEAPMPPSLEAVPVKLCPAPSGMPPMFSSSLACSSSSPNMSSLTFGRKHHVNGTVASGRKKVAKSFSHPRELMPHHLGGLAHVHTSSSPEGGVSWTPKTCATMEPLM